MKLWLDAIESPPDSSWTWVTNDEQCMDMLKDYKVSTLSLNDELDVLLHIEERWMVWARVPPICMEVRTTDQTKRIAMFNKIEEIINQIEP